MKKKALVISGGGSRGAFAVGAVKYLVTHHPKVDFDIYVGTSTGALIVPLVALENIALLERMYTTVRTEDIILGGNLAARLLDAVSLFNAKPLSNLIETYYKDEVVNKIFTLDKKVFVTTACLQTSTSVIFSTKEPPLVTDYEVVKMKSANEFRRAVLASACQPVFMQPVEVHQGVVPVRQYVDGGVMEYMGIQLAIDAGAEEVYAISLSVEKSKPLEKKFTQALDILFRTIDMFTADVGTNDVRIPQIYNRALHYLEEVKKRMRKDGVPEAKIDQYFNLPFHNQFAGKKPVIIHSIYPDAPLDGGPGGLQFDPVKMKEMVRSGEKKMKEYMERLSTGNSV